MHLNQPAPDFELPDLNGTLYRLNDQRGKIVIINFWSCECPHSERADANLCEWMLAWGGAVEWLSVAVNRSESLVSVVAAVNARSVPSVVFDAAHVVTDLYEAVTTPHVFVVDADGILRYRGAVDDVTFRQRTPTRFFLREVVDSLIERHLPTLTETPAFGCTIVREV